MARSTSARLDALPRPGSLVRGERAVDRREAAIELVVVVVHVGDRVIELRPGELAGVVSDPSLERRRGRPDVLGAVETRERDHEVERRRRLQVDVAEVPELLDRILEVRDRLLRAERVAGGNRRHAAGGRRAPRPPA